MAAHTSVIRTVRHNGTLARLLSSYALFIVTEYSAWTAVLVLAYDHGGPTAAGLVAFAQLVPAALLAPVLSTVADRGWPVRLLVGGYAVQAVGMACTAAAAASGLTMLAYLAAIVASSAIVTARPGQAALLPTLAASAEELTAANVAMGWVESVGIVVAGILTGSLLAASGPALVLAVMAALVLGSLALVLSLRGHAGVASGAAGPQARPLREGVRIVSHDPVPRLLVSVITAGWVLVGALDVLFVVLALDLLEVGEGWVGYLQTAFGVGGVVAGALTARLVGAPLGKPILWSGLALSAALALTAVAPGVVVTAALLAGVGAGRAVLDVAGRTLLQRAVQPAVLGRVFGVVEGLAMAGLAVGALLVPAFAALGGGTAAVLGVAALLPIAGAVGGRALLTLDAAATVPVVEIGLLQSLNVFATLPPPAVEGLAHSLERMELPTGTVLIREGETGDHYYVIGAGHLQVSQAGVSLGTLGRGDGVGEIALLRNVARTATVTAATASTVYRLGREPFLAAVTGHASVHASAEHVVETRLRNADPDAARGGGEPP